MHKTRSLLGSFSLFKYDTVFSSFKRMLICSRVLFINVCVVRCMAFFPSEKWVCPWAEADGVVENDLHPGVWTSQAAWFTKGLGPGGSCAAVGIHSAVVPLA